MQNYANHRQFTPLFHFIVAPLLIANFIYLVRFALRAPNGPHIMAAITGFTLVLLALVARTMALKVQDRVIRLEMRLRLRDVLPADMHSKIRSLSESQLVGLRFASDAELPSLVGQVLKDNITSADAIKKMIKTWEPDTFRA